MLTPLMEAIVFTTSESGSLLEDMSTLELNNVSVLEISSNLCLIVKSLDESLI